MYTLRIITPEPEGEITNIWLGTSYSKKIYPVSLDKGEFDDVFGEIIAHDTDKQYKLSDDCLYYIMTDSGKTFEYINRA
jgi:hypothetical protein